MPLSRLSNAAAKRPGVQRSLEHLPSTAACGRQPSTIFQRVKIQGEDLRVRQAADTMHLAVMPVRWSSWRHRQARS